MSSLAGTSLSFLEPPKPTFHQLEEFLTP
jgi:hypothetical protein